MTTRRAIATGGLAVALVLLAMPGLAAAGTTPPKAFVKGAAALKEGRLRTAVEQFELLADQGFVHPDASYDRGLAYARRSGSPDAQPGDLGRAAAAFREATVLRPGDREAAAALRRVRKEVSRKLAHEGRPIHASPSLPRLLTGLLPESAWALLGLIGAALAALGLAAHRLVTTSTLKLSAAIAGFTGAGLMILGGGLRTAAVHFRTTSQLAVVVSAGGARLRDDAGTPLKRSAERRSVIVPEGADVHVLDRRGARARIEWSGQQAWIGAGDIRVMPSRGRPR